MSDRIRMALKRTRIYLSDTLSDFEIWPPVFPKVRPNTTRLREECQRGGVYLQGRSPDDCRMDFGELKCIFHKPAYIMVCVKFRR